MRALSRLVALFVLLCAPSCEQKRETRQACWDARQAVRDAIARDELGAAPGLLEEARSVCAGQSTDDLRRIEVLLEDRRRAKQELERAAAERERAMAFPTQQFIAWATAPLEEFSRSLDEVRCAERGAADFGFCEATRKGSPQMTLRYWEHERKAVRYTFTTELPLECEDLGEHRRVRSWSVGQKSYELCELTERRARNLSALLVRGEGSNQLHIFSFEYLKRDPAFEQLLRTRG